MKQVSISTSVKWFPAKQAAFIHSIRAASLRISLNENLPLTQKMKKADSKFASIGKREKFHSLIMVALEMIKFFMCGKRFK